MEFDDRAIQRLYNMAKSDTMDGVGRLIISDVCFQFHDRAITAEQILQVWNKAYPDYTAVQRLGNIILIYWDGLETVKNVRSMRPPVSEDFEFVENDEAKDVEG